ncbi:MAG: Hcp family type VI secretion system effector [Planctomycetota bacterium]|jgi:type VI secretion system secreted protein Hcp
MIVIDFQGKIKGDSTIDEHTDWIKCQAMQMGVGRGVSGAIGKADRETSQPSFSEMTFSKETDIASNELFAQASYGKKLCDKATIHVLQTSGEGASQPYLEYEIHEPIISSYSISAATGGGPPSESFSVSFTKIVQKYTQFKAGGQQKKADPKGFDLATGKPFNG